MKKLLLTLLLALSLTTPALAQKKQPVGVTHDAEITRVVDGDTVGFKATFLPAPLKPELLIRIYGVDTPEKGFRAGCPAEKAQGEKASAFTKNVIATAKKHQIVLYRWDKFGGRVLGDVILDGQRLSSLLMQNGFAREYYGDAKISWCD